MNPESNENNSDVLNLESFNTEYKNLLIEYKLAVSNYVNYLKQEAKRPCVEYTGDTKGISQECYNDIWQKSGCGGGNIGYPSAAASWQQSQTMNGLIQDSWYWATMTDYIRRMGCYGQPGNPYTIIGVGTDGNLYSRQGLDAPWQIVNDNSGGQIVTVFTGTDGKLYATNNVNEIIYKNNWSDSGWGGWGTNANTCCVIGAAMGQNGAIVGVGTDHKLYTIPNLNGTWTQTASGGEWCGYVTIAPDGTLFVIGSDNNVDKKNSYQTLSSENWQGMGSGTVKAITIAPDGTFIGVGMDDQLYTKASYKDLSTSWQGPYNSENSSCCVVSITTVPNYSYNSSQFNRTTQPNFNVNSVPMTSVKGTTFWGASSLSQSTLKTVGECEALCSTTAGCSGATYNETSTICSLRKGDGDIMTGGSADYSIVPKSLSLLKIVQNINDKLTQVNEKIQKISQPIETQFNAEAQQRSTSNTNLIDQYNNLVEERDKIQRMLNEYQTVDEQQVEGNIHISQNYYSLILLMLLAILVIFLLYKFSMPSAQSSTTFVQNGGELGTNGGELGTNAYYMVFGLFLLVLLFTLYNKYANLITYSNMVYVLSVFTVSPGAWFSSRWR
jgi:hypothetical protein